MTASGGLPILDGLSLDVAAGEVTALVGESGCGKTSFGLALLGFARPGTAIASGRVLLGNEDLLRLSEEKLRRLRGVNIAYVPQDPAASLDPRQTIRRQILEVFEEHPTACAPGEREATLLRLLEEVVLTPAAAFSGRYPFELSGGQQQRAMIALALACHPQFVVLDEPTTGLDVTTQRHILDLIKTLAQGRGTGFIYITHDLAVVADLADRVTVMYAGRIMELAAKRRIFAAAQHPYTRRLLRSAPRLEACCRLEGIAGTAPAVGHRPQGCAFRPRCGHATTECETEPPLTEVEPGHWVRCRHIHAALFGATPVNTVAASRATPGSVLLQVQDLKASQGHGTDRREVLHGISFELFAGECLSIVGESGSGKTTLGRCISGLHRADSGNMALDGRGFPFNLRQRSQSVRRAIQMVFQNPDRCLNPVRSVKNTLWRYLAIAQSETSVTELLERVGLSRQTLDRYPRELSGGERQRVAIAGALALQPRILVCDEVTSALDVSVQATVVNLLRELARDGLALIFITHNLPLVASIAQRVIVLQNGEVREQGQVTDVLERPTQGYTKALIEDLPRFAEDSRP